ncbi:hypothetical protein MAP00_000933 [Monascus purpureus]|nr:hypothetical protein MAP00_000933 [Monascus purpureus]
MATNAKGGREMSVPSGLTGERSKAQNGENQVLVDFYRCNEYWGYEGNECTKHGEGLNLDSRDEEGCCDVHGYSHYNMGEESDGTA